MAEQTELTDAEKRVLYELRRLQAAAENTVKMAEAGQYGAAYENLIRVDGMATRAKGWVSMAMTERRWRRG